MVQQQIERAAPSPQSIANFDTVSTFQDVAESGAEHSSLFESDQSI
jgi:hypothetical protein